MNSTAQPFTNVQLELLKVFSHQLADQDFIKFKKVLADFFAEIAIREANTVWDNENWDDEKVAELLETKLRRKKR